MPMSSNEESGKVILLSLMGNFALTIAKTICFFFTRSPSMMAESIHSFGDSFNQLLLLIGNRKGRIGPCHQYPMGHGRAIYLFNLFASQGIILGAIYTIYHGVHILMHPTTDPILLNYSSFIILGISGVLEAWILFVAMKSVLKQKGEKPFLQYLKESDDPGLIAILFEDSIAVLGAMLAFIGILISYKTQSIIPDAIATLTIGLLLLVMAIVLFKVNYKLIVGTSIPKYELDEIRGFISKQTEVQDILHITSEILAPSKVRLSMEVEFHGHHIGNQMQIRERLSKIQSHENNAKLLSEQRDQTIRNLGNIIDDLESKIQKEFPTITLLDIEPA